MSISMKTERFIKNWEKSRSKGKTIFVLKYCIMMGFAMFAGHIIGRLATGNSFDLVYSLSFLIGGLIGGIIGGMIIWFLNEERYRAFERDGLRK